MVRAVAKTGSRAGKPLWRCSDFDCPTLINIDDPDHQPAPTPAAGTSAQAEYERERAEYAARLRSGAVFLTAAAVFLTLLGFFVGLALSADVRVAAGIAAAVLVGLAWFFLRYLPNDIVYWRRGAEAEHAIGARLDRLERLGFITLYDRRIPGRGGNIDAVTVGPPGVFVVEVKYRGRGVEVFQGELEVGGHA